MKSFCQHMKSLSKHICIFKFYVIDLFGFVSVCITVGVEYLESTIFFFLIKRGHVEFSKYTIYSKYLNAAIGTTSRTYKISSSASLFETTQPCRHTHAHTSFHHYVMTTKQNFVSGNWLERGRTHFTGSEKAEVNL